MTLTSSNTSAVTVPASITIPSGQTTGTFTATSLLVGSQATVTLTATYNGSKTGTVTVNPIVLNSLSISPSSVYGLVANATGTVTRRSAAPTGGIAVSLSSSDTNAATVNPTVTGCGRSDHGHLPDHIQDRLRGLGGDNHRNTECNEDGDADSQSAHHQ